MASRVDTQLGHRFEKDVQAALTELQSKERLRFLRLYDSRSAGSFLPPQPADFLVAYTPFTALLECKASEKFTSLRQCLSSHVDAAQAAQMRLWTERTCHPAYVLFYSFVEGVLEVWGGWTVAQSRANGTPLHLHERLHHHPSHDLTGLLRKLFVRRRHTDGDDDHDRL